MIISNSNKENFLNNIWSSLNKISDLNLFSNKYPVSQEEINTLTNEYKALVNCSIDNLDMSNRDLSNVVFSLSEFTRINFCNSLLVNSRLGAHTFEDQGSNFNGCNFSFANLQDSDLSVGDFSGCVFNGANLRNVFLFHANLQGSSLIGANIAGAVVDKHTILPSKEFSVVKGSYLIGPDVVVSNSDFSFTDFYELNLQKTNFSGSDLSLARFVGSDLRGAVLNGVTLHLTNFTGVLFDENTILPSKKYNLQEGLVTRKVKKKVKRKYSEKILFEKDEMISSRMNVLVGPNLKIINVVFYNLELRSFDFSRSNFYNVSFNHCDFFLSNFSNCLLSEVSFNQSNLANVDFSSSIIGENVDFRGANLRGAKITFYQLKGAFVDETTILPAGFVYDLETRTVVELNANYS